MVSAGLLLGAALSGVAWCLREVAPLLGAALLLSSRVWLQAYFFSGAAPACKVSVA